MTIYRRNFKNYKKKLNFSGDGMHRVQRGLRPSLFLCLKPFVQPGHCLIHALLREREGSAFFLIVRRLFKAPGLRIYVCGKGSAVFAVVACKVIPHSLMASGERLLLQSAEGYKSFINQEIYIRPFQSYRNVPPVRCTQCQPEILCRELFRAAVLNLLYLYYITGRLWLQILL